MYIGQQVVVFDIDDILADFRHEFARWIKTNKNISVDPLSKSYYFIEEVIADEDAANQLVDDFFSDGQGLTIPVISACNVVNQLSRDGIWIHLITARPEYHTICHGHTLQWLVDAGIQYNELSFSSTKIKQIKQAQHTHNAIICCVDDGPTHVQTYAHHGIRCLMPIKPYNRHVVNSKDMASNFIHEYNDDAEMYDIISRLRTSKIQ